MPLQALFTLAPIQTGRHGAMATNELAELSAGGAIRSGRRSTRRHAPYGGEVSEAPVSVSASLGPLMLGACALAPVSTRTRARLSKSFDQANAQVSHLKSTSKPRGFGVGAITADSSTTQPAAASSLWAFHQGPTPPVKAPVKDQPSRRQQVRLAVQAPIVAAPPGLATTIPVRQPIRPTTVSLVRDGTRSQQPQLRRPRSAPASEAAPHAAPAPRGMGDSMTGSGAGGRKQPTTLAEGDCGVQQQPISSAPLRGSVRRDRQLNAGTSAASAAGKLSVHGVPGDSAKREEAGLRSFQSGIRPIATRGGGDVGKESLPSASVNNAEDIEVNLIDIAGYSLLSGTSWTMSAGRYAFERTAQLQDGGKHVIIRRLSTARALLGKTGSAEAERELAVLSLLCNASSDSMLRSRLQPVVDVFDGDDAGTSYVCLEPLAGRSLKQTLHVKGAMLDRDVHMVASQLCDALQHLHGINIAHRSVRPENVRILDVQGGEACHGESCGGVRVTLSNYSCALVCEGGAILRDDRLSYGLDAYTPPEARTDEPYSGPPLDLWACAA